MRRGWSRRRWSAPARRRRRRSMRWSSGCCRRRRSRVRMRPTRWTWRLPTTTLSPAGGASAALSLCYRRSFRLCTGHDGFAPDFRPFAAARHGSVRGEVFFAYGSGNFGNFRRARRMIARLRGLLDSFGADHAVIDVNGVGYLVSASSRTLSSLGAIGEEVVLHTEMLVAEDVIR